MWLESQIIQGVSGKRRKTMKAVVIRKYGGPEELKFEDFPDPVLAPGEVLVKTFATSINPFDLKIRSGAVKDRVPLEFPAILGLDVSGTVTAVGAGVKSFTVGDKVFAQAMKCYATLCAVKADELAKLPDGMGLESAAAIPTVTNTGAQLADLAQNNGLKATVLVLGAVGNVGRCAVYRLKEHSATVIAGVLKKQASDAKKTGADMVVALDDDKEIASLPVLDAIADTISGSNAAKAVRKLKSGGTFASVLAPPPNASERPDMVVKTMAVKNDAKMLLEMARAVQSGKLSIPLGKSFPLRDASAAHAAAEAGSPGKIVLLV
jgi:NADPH:quinone reductase-like Zn-dependent oxidoreductase